MDFQSHRTQLVLTALAAGATSVAALSAYQSWDRQRRRGDLARDVLRAVDAKPARASPTLLEREDEDEDFIETLDRRTPDALPLPDGLPFNEELIREQLARNYAFFGEEGMRRIRGGSVVIVGCGGVGSWAAVMLARS
jgi:tRNA threonylcarbamoyladenosine dehydratase